MRMDNIIFNCKNDSNMMNTHNSTLLWTCARTNIFTFTKRMIYLGTYLQLQ